MIYCIASRLNDLEYLIVNPDIPNHPIGPLCCRTMEDVKSYFKHFYEVLTKEQLGSRIYMDCLEKLQTIHPVIIGIPKFTAEAILDKWIGDQIGVTRSMSIIERPHRILSMKEGFISKFQILDIVRDIESITRINSKGGTEIVKFRVKPGSEGEQSHIEILTEDKEKEVLRKRGFI